MESFSMFLSRVRDLVSRLRLMDSEFVPADVHLFVDRECPGLEAGDAVAERIVVGGL